MSFFAELGKTAREIDKRPTDLVRIKSLPLKVKYAPNLAAILTDTLKRPEGTMSLRHVQAQALQDCTQARGLVAFIPVGGGKSLLSLLIPMVVGCKRAVLLVPPDLKAKLIKHDYPTLSKHWHLPSLDKHTLVPGAPTIYPVAYTELSSKKDADVLERIGPDVIIADEAHTLTTKGFSSRKVRFKHYFKAHPETRLYVMSGTLLQRSIVDLAALFKLCLREGSPMPFDFHTLLAWGALIDPQDPRVKEQEQWRIEAAKSELSQLAPGSTNPRDAFHQRLFSTYGVLKSTTKRECNAGLIYHERPITAPPEVTARLEELRKTWQLDQEIYTDKLALSRAARQLAVGLYTRWIWPRNEPKELIKRWLVKRSTWHSCLRDFLQNRAKPGADSPDLVKHALLRGELSKEFELKGALEDWLSIQESCQPEDDVVWVSDYVVKDAVKWGQKHVGIIWYRDKALGPAIAREGGYPLYQDANDAESLLQEDGSRTIVASANVFYKGQNLQCFSKQLLTFATGNGSVMQQLLGRTMREGQKADNVETWVYRHTPELKDAWRRGKEDAQFKQEVLKEEQYLLLGTESWVDF